MRILKRNFFLLSLFIFAFLCLVFAIILVNKVDKNIILGLDIRAFYTSGLMINHKITNNFYDFSTQYYWQKTVFPVPKIQFLMPFFNPPFVALIFSPLALFSIKSAYVAFSIINIIIALVSFYLITSQIYKSSEKPKHVLSLVLIIFCFPAWITVFQGQFSFFALLGFVASWYCFKREKSMLAGFFLSLLWIRPQLILLPILLLILKKQWRAIFGLCLASAILGLISIYLVGVQGIINYINLLFKIPYLGDSYSIHPQLEPTLRGFFQVILHTNALSDVIFPLIIGFVVIISMLIFSLKGEFKPKATEFDFQWSILILIVILTNLHMNYYDLVFVLFPCLILLNVIRKFLTSYIFILIISLCFLIIADVPSLSAIMLFILILIFIKILLNNGFSKA